VALCLGLLLAGGCTTDENVPSECVGVDNLFGSEECLESLMVKCRAIATEDDCWAARPIEVGSGTVVHCAWTNVVSVDDEETCEFGSIFGRCEAALEANWGSVDPCVDGAFVGPGHGAFLETKELVEVASAPDGRLYEAPLGPWTVLESDANSTIATCSGGGPEWCSCGAAACLATGE
jgi:hypothetical protein